MTDARAANTITLLLIVALAIVLFVRPKSTSPRSGAGLWSTPYYLRYNTPIYSPNILNIMPVLSNGYGNGFNSQDVSF